jgi:aspartate-semialdehyde dehydrogenase
MTPTNPECPTVAILGASGLVGDTILKLLEKRNFPVGELRLLSSARSAGESRVFRNRVLTLEEARPDAFEDVDIVLASAGGAVSEALAPEAVKRGAVVIDNTSFFRMKEDVPLVVAGVNDADCHHHKGIIANPNCSTAQLMPVLKTLDDLAGLDRVVVSTYQSASGAGQKGIAALLEQTGRVVDDITCRDQQPNVPFNRPLGLNIVPHIDSFLPNGYTKEEQKLIDETKKILHRPDLRVTATAVRVPVMIGHSESVTLDFKTPITPKAVIDALQKNPLLRVSQSDEAFPTPLDAEGQEPVYVGRIRQDSSNPERGINLWVVADNLLIGAALNAVRIAEYLVSDSFQHHSSSQYRPRSENTHNLTGSTVITHTT